MSEDEKTLPLATSRSPAELIVRLAEIIKAAGLSRSQAASIIKVERVTLWRWFTSKRSPEARTVENAIHRIESHALTRLKLEDSHHLYLDPAKGYQMRVTVTRDPKKIGIRIKETLGTHDMMEAIKLRDAFVKSYRKMGLEVADRRQKKTKNIEK